MSLIETLSSENYGFVTEKDMPEIIKEDRFQQILIRCGAGRFICPAQDTEHFINIITKEKSDYVRDASLYRA